MVIFNGGATVNVELHVTGPWQPVELVTVNVTVLVPPVATEGAKPALLVTGLVQPPVTVDDANHAANLAFTEA
jgi:hypothetical protein